MGKLIYGSPGDEIDFEDRLLAHVQVAVITKLRRDEKFAMSWNHGVDAGSGHSTIWLHPGIPLRFKFSGNRTPTLNRAWLEALLSSANSSNGLHMVPEPDEAPRA